ncbi:MAG: hypothetical protein WC475_01665 [Candidatus Paceibacterota bacterium]
MKFNRKNFHLLIFDNTDNALLESALMPIAQKIKKQFKSARYYKTYREGGSVLRGERNDDFHKSKIYPISEMQHDIIKLITTDIFVQMEDDELPQNPNTIPRLLRLLKRNNVVLATGVSSARNPERLPVGMGVHKVVERDGDRITKRICCSPKIKGVQYVQGTGFYCFAAYSKNWLEVLDDARNVASGLPHWAFDTWTTNQLIQHNHYILADFDCWCDHLQLTSSGPYLFNKKDAVLDAYVFIPELGIYAYWQNSNAYGWVIDDEQIAGNSKRAGTEILRR